MSQKHWFLVLSNGDQKIAKQSPRKRHRQQKINLRRPAHSGAGQAYPPSQRQTLLEIPVVRTRRMSGSQPTTHHCDRQSIRAGRASSLHKRSPSTRVKERGNGNSVRPKGLTKHITI
eukprot:2720359-Amphidinium_carterae.1